LTAGLEVDNIINLSDTTKNVYKNFQGDFIRFVQGRNELKITANAEVTFINQYQLGIR
jgi:hypothetical protein